MARGKIGLRVKHCTNVARYDAGKSRKMIEAVPDGFFIQVRRCGRWYSLMDLRFVRERDAVRAAQSLITAGIDSHNAMVKAGMVMVKQVAVEHLWW